MSRISGISVYNLWQLLESLGFDFELSNTIWGLIIELMCQRFFSWIIRAPSMKAMWRAVSCETKCVRQEFCLQNQPAGRTERTDWVRGPNKAGLINPPRLQQHYTLLRLPASVTVSQCHSVTVAQPDTCDIVGFSIKLSNITTYRHWNYYKVMIRLLKNKLRTKMCPLNWGPDRRQYY